MLLFNLVLFVFSVTIPLLLFEVHKAAPSFLFRTGAYILLGTIWAVVICFIVLAVWDSLSSWSGKLRRIEDLFEGIASSVGLKMNAVTKTDDGENYWQGDMGGFWNRIPVQVVVTFLSSAVSDDRVSVSVTLSLPRQTPLSLHLRPRPGFGEMVEDDRPEIEFLMREDLLVFGEPSAMAEEFIGRTAMAEIVDDKGPWEFGGMRLEKETLQIYVVGKRPRDFLPRLLDRCAALVEGVPLP